MKENKYDDESFFRKYGEMGRSKEGLIAAGEWETMKALLPDFKGKRMLDIGCGYGWHCIYAVERGGALRCRRGYITENARGRQKKDVLSGD